MKNSSLHTLLFLFSGLLTLHLTGCTTMEKTTYEKPDPLATWPILPFQNHTETPQVNLRAEAISIHLLLNKGITNLKHYPAELTAETILVPANQKAFANALVWAKQEGIRYGVTGEVTEWRYKVGIDGEPAVGVTLRVIDLNNDRTIFSAVGGKSGWSREALAGLAQKLLHEMFNGLETIR